MEIIELRSDTFTKPTPAMLQAMMAAKVGDDVFGEDAAVNELESYAAGLFGMEAAIFCPSGTMTNQLAIKCHTQAGDEVICDEMSHIYQYEGGGIAFNSACSVKLIKGNRGRISAKDVLGAINPDDVHKANSRLVSLENTANRGGGSCYDFDEILQIRNVCGEHGLSLHLDGARIFNALISRSETPKQYGEAFDSISICLSKGLGAPVGSVLIGKKDFIKKARRFRKVFGGGMRQAGFLAAAGQYALQHQIERLATDHLHAKTVANALEKKDWVKDMLPVETNIVIFSVHGKYTAAELARHFQQKDVRCIAISPTQVRMVFHLDVTESMINRLLEIISNA